MAVIRKINDKKKNANSNVDKENPYMLPRECKLVQPPWVSVWRFLN